MKAPAPSKQSNPLWRKVAQRLVREARGLSRRLRPAILRDVNRRGRGPRALLSYISHPFVHSKTPPSHTNVMEARTWAELLGELGYQVDVVDYDSRILIDYRDYGVVCGFGEPMERTWDRYGPDEMIRVTYATGVYIHLANHVGLARLVAYHRRGGRWTPEGARVIASAWPAQFMLAELLVVLGNRTAEETYRPWRLHGRTEHLPCFFLESAGQPLRSGERRDIVWFGSSGCLHKGLDLTMAALRRLPGIRLHVCGAAPHEVVAAGLKQMYADVWEQIEFHGHIAVGSDAFRGVFERCRVVVHPSASEGSAPSVLTAVAHGSVIPVITKMTCLDLPEPTVYVDDSEEGIADGIRSILGMSASHFEVASERLRQFVRASFGYEEYRNRLKAILTACIPDVSAASPQ